MQFSQPSVNNRNRIVLPAATIMSEAFKTDRETPGFCCDYPAWDDPAPHGRVAERSKALV